MDRDFLLELLSANAIIGVHLSRLAEEVNSDSSFAFLAIFAFKVWLFPWP
jgi:argininosuccinate lyase